MALSDARLAAQAAFVARRLLSDGLVKAAAAADLRRALETALVEDRDRERALDDEVKKILAAERGDDPRRECRLRRDVPEGEEDARRQEEDSAVRNA